MDVSNIIAEIDGKILHLQDARTVLLNLYQTEGASATSEGPAAKRRGRPKGSKNTTTSTTNITPAKKPRHGITPAGRKAISEAMRLRWAERRKQDKK